MLLQRQSSIQTEEQKRGGKMFNDLCEFFQSPEWIIPIDSFIEEYCLYFAPDATHESLKEKQRIFQEYKKTINSMLQQFLEKHEMAREYLMELIMHNAHKISAENFNFLLAVEDFDVFTLFMTERNKQLNSYSMAQLKNEEELLRQAQRKSTLQALEQKDQKDLSEKEEYKIAVIESIDEENRRKQKLLNEENEEQRLLRQILEQSEREEAEKRRRLSEAEMEEEMMLKLAMQESLRLEEERLRLQRLNTVQEQKSQCLIEQPQQHIERKETDFRIKNKKKQQFEKVLPVISPVKQQPTEASETQQNENPQSQVKKEEQESIEERQRRLRAWRDALKKKEQENQQPQISSKNEETIKDNQTKNNNERLQRCLNVLKEAAHEVFQGQLKKQEIQDIDYYQQEEDKDDDDEGEIILINQGRKKVQSKEKQNIKKNPQVLEVEWSDDDEDDENDIQQADDI